MVKLGDYVDQFSPSYKSVMWRSNQTVF